jgi:hypothetical protein
MARTLAAHGLLYEESPPKVDEKVESPGTDVKKTRTIEQPVEWEPFNNNITDLLKKSTDDQIRTHLNKFFKDPVYETRYHHIARIWDLLAVLRVIQLHAEKDLANDNFKNVALYSRGAAKKLMQLALADPPDATRAPKWSRFARAWFQKRRNQPAGGMIEART